MDVAEREAVDDLNLATAEGRGHASLPHTADAGLVAAGPDLAALFEEAAAALGEIAAEVDAGAEPTVWRDVATDGADLVELAYAWLNELIALADIDHAAVVATTVEAIDRPAPIDASGGEPATIDGGSQSDTTDGPAGDPVSDWALRARVGLRPFAAGGVRVLGQLKSATYHGLTVEPDGTGWRLVAYLDL